MTDNEMRGIILKNFYDRRREGYIQPKPQDFDPPIPLEDLYSVCDQLYEYGLITWKSIESMGRCIHGTGKISARGIDVVEDEGKSSPIKINFQNISISKSQGIQIGNHNVQSFISSAEQLIHQIDESDSSPKEKQEAKLNLMGFLPIL